MESGDVITFRDQDDVVQLAMKVHYPDGNKSHVIGFLKPRGDKQSTVLLGLRSNFARDHTLLILDNLEITPTDKDSIVGMLELNGHPPESGRLGLADNKAF